MRRLPPPLLVALLLALLPAAPARAAWDPPPGVDLTRPRLLFRPGDEARLQDRMTREPYRTVVRHMLERAALADSVALDDDTIDAQRFKARAARVHAFLYALDRTWDGTQVVPFPSAAARQAAGDRVRDWLLHLYPRSRLAAPPPYGDWDRDISSSEELLQYASAYDALVGAGYPFAPADEAEIVRRLTDLASELYENYVDPSTALLRADAHQNNHRSKTGAALAMAAIALAEHTPAPGSDPRGVRDPADWLAYGLDQVDRVQRWFLNPGDGVYGEGPFYLRFACQNLLPFARAWDGLVDGAPVVVGGRTVRSLWRDPVFVRSQRWLLDMTLPDGSLAPQDDANAGRAHYFGAAPTATAEDAAAFAWRWAHAPAPFETDGNVEMGPDAIAVYDDGVVPAPPPGSPTRFYPDGGNAIFRSDWGPQAVVAVVQAEHDEAASLGRDRDGRGVGPQSHDHAEPGAFLLHAFGERLAMDPGFVSFTTRLATGKPENHSLILVDGRGPLDLLGATFLWSNHPFTRPPADGMVTLHDLLDTGFVDAARVVSRYGTGSYDDPYAGAPRIERRFLFADDRYLLVADALDAEPGSSHVFTWLVHGNGGGTSGGSFAPTALGARWERPAARLDAALASDAGPPALGSRSDLHEAPGKQLLSHETLTADLAGSRLRSLLLLYPSPAAAPPPTLADLSLPGVAGLRLDDPTEDRRVVVLHRAAGSPPLVVDPAASGLRAFALDGRLALLDAHADGRLRLAFAEGAQHLAYPGAPALASARTGRLGMRPLPGVLEAVAETGTPSVTVSGLGFAPAGVDGACALEPAGEPGAWRVRLGRERRFRLRADAGNGRPAADPGPDRRVAVGSEPRLEGGASCDADGDALTPRWELVAAPPGSDWRLEDADTWTPRLAVDRPGPFRVELVVTDAHGAASLPARVTVIGGGVCEDGVDDDADGRIDTDDPDCDAPAPLGEGRRCGLGFEAALALAPLVAWRTRRRRRAASATLRSPWPPSPTA